MFQGESDQMSSAVAEVKKLNEQLSSLRQENIVLKVGSTHDEHVQVEDKKALVRHHELRVDTNSREKTRGVLNEFSPSRQWLDLQHL